MLKAGVIGLGMIGGGVAICLARAGSLAAVYDVRPDAAASLEGVSDCVASPAALAELCDIFIIAVVDADQVRGVLNGDNGLLSTAKSGSVVILQSTLSLPDLKEITEIAAKAGVIVVDCGVTGGTQSATKGLTSLVGADDETFTKIESILNDFSKTVVHMGGFGAGMAAKIARNVIVYNVWRAGYEGALLAEAAGVDVKKLAAAILASEEAVGGPTTWMTRESEPEEDANEKALRQHVRTMLTKDLSAAIELAGDVDVELPMAELSRATASTMLRIEE